MPRVKGGFQGMRKRKRILRQAKGFFSARHRLLRTAVEAVDNALKTAYKGRKLRKRDFRAVWQTRIAAAVRTHGVSYSKFMGALKANNIELNRKMLSEMAVHHPADFEQLVTFANK